MSSKRVIPTLLLDNGGLVKTIRFKNPRYIGDPINTVRIFNEKEADELLLLDIRASLENRNPDFQSIEQIVSEAFMPIGYGGGINHISQIEKLFKIGVEKVIINSSLFTDPQLIVNSVRTFGSQSIVASIDIKRDLFNNYKVYFTSGTRKHAEDTITTLKRIEQMGVGEIIINSIDKDGTMNGYDLTLISLLANTVSVPVVASGGASDINDFVMAIRAGASAVAAGSLFVFQGIHKAVLISYITSNELEFELNK